MKGVEARARHFTLLGVLPVCISLVWVPVIAIAQQGNTTVFDAISLYRSIRQFDLGGSARVDNLLIARDRATITFTGTFYFSQPVAGRVTGAVFIGQGKFSASPPPSVFERENLERMLKTDIVESDFKTAVFRFTDDTDTVIGALRQPAGSAPKEALKLAKGFEGRLLRETGINASSRLLLSLLNEERPGFFIAQFDGGKRGRFTFLLDHQCRVPAGNFGIDGGEKGLIFAHDSVNLENNVWVAFYSLEDYRQRKASYADAFNLTATRHYSLHLDLREPRRLIKLSAGMDLDLRQANSRAIPFRLSESLGEDEDHRLKKALKPTGVRLSDGSKLGFVREDWEGGFTMLLPPGLKDDQKLKVVVEIEGDFIDEDTDIEDFYYPRISTQWYPRHARLERSTYDIAILHKKRYRAVSGGERLEELPCSDDPSAVISRFRLAEPVGAASFAIGLFELHVEKRRLSFGEMTLEFDSAPATVMDVKENFILAEFGNALDYFSGIFGPYPYRSFRAAIHPFPVGRGLPTMVLIPKADRASKHVYSFIAHETAHQWWGGAVAWRCYRDQWLSEGFAEYSGLLYTRLRDGRGSFDELLRETRDSLLYPPTTDQGIGDGHVTDIGPLILGHRLETCKSWNAYTTLIYNKGALVLRMLHFLFTDPESGSGDAFFRMMKDFVDRHSDRPATTESFMEVANEHFVNTPVAQMYRIQNLDWFFRQWVLQTALPSYRLEYRLENMGEGKVAIRGTLHQDNAPADWIMALPIVIKYKGGKASLVSAIVVGPQSPVNLVAPMRPEAVELDPENWVLSEKTYTKKQ